MRTRLICLFLFAVFSVKAQIPQIKSFCEQINQLNTQVTNNTISKVKAAEQFKGLIEQLKAVSNIQSNGQWVFPLKGYHANAIGGTHGNGYSAAGYNYLDGNKHTAHPAHDIFINDRNQDNLDDRTQKPVDVLAATDGIVIACCNEWENSSVLRGGKYIWIYHPSLDMITYYAHNQAIFVSPGYLVKQGQKIAEVGRTGFNAYKKRSPTHLHFSSFRLIKGLPVPFNRYTELLKSKSL